ncbi:hypothetical protein [Flagellimonas beolgyonensis]|uniref:hypothetical protein n=1 Tax=Flagellimonas beolgyonensis TaxID=864064 RepID=UPI000F8D7422|nr:hypothetical protein [Allomuricauda beolgyonensis]
MRIKYLLTAFLLLIISCSENSGVEQNTTPELNLSLTNFDTNTVGLNFSLNGDFNQIKLIWNLSNIVDENNHIGSKDLNLNNTEATVEQLKPNTNYYFRIQGIIDNLEYYSNIVEVSTLELSYSFNLLFDEEILSNNGNNYISEIKQIVRTNDGFIILAQEEQFASNNTAIKILKFDFNFILIWSKTIDESPNHQDNFAGLLNLGNQNYIAIARKFNYSNSGLYNHQVYGCKFDNNGNIEWVKNYSSLLNDASTNLDYTIEFENNSNELKVLFAADSTYYGSNNDTYVREVILNDNGDIINENIIGSNYDFPLWKIKYAINGDFYNYGNVDIIPNDGLITWDAMLEKYTSSNSLLWSKNYGNYGADDSADNIFIENDAITIVGKNGHENGFDGESRWVIQTNNSGEINWDFKESRNQFIYQGKDITVDSEGNYLALFFDIYYPDYHAYNLATLIKFDTNGNIVWKYIDGEDYNQDSFQPSRVLETELNNYTIFGINDGRLWVKQIEVNN